MTRDEILGMVHAWARAVAACDLDALDRLVAAQLREGVLARTRALHAAFEGVEVVAVQVAIEGETVAWRWRLSGVHVGAIGGVAPSGAHRAMDGVNFQRVGRGRIVDHWTLVDFSPLGRL